MTWCSLQPCMMQCCVDPEGIWIVLQKLSCKLIGQQFLQRQKSIVSESLVNWPIITTNACASISTYVFAHKIYTVSNLVVKLFQTFWICLHCKNPKSENYQPSWWAICSALQTAMTQYQQRCGSEMLFEKVKLGCLAFGLCSSTITSWALGPVVLPATQRYTLSLWTYCWTSKCEQTSAHKLTAAMCSRTGQDRIRTISHAVLFNMLLFIVLCISIHHQIQM